MGEPVLAHPRPAPAHVVGPVFEGATNVGVRGATPGAWIEIYVIDGRDGDGASVSTRV